MTDEEYINGSGRDLADQLLSSAATSGTADQQINQLNVCKTAAVFMVANLALGVAGQTPEEFIKEHFEDCMEALALMRKEIADGTLQRKEIVDDEPNEIQ